MVTKEQAQIGRTFHYGECKQTVGPRGGVKTKVEEWRANGQCKTWVTRPEEFSLPIAHGLYNHSYIDHLNADQFHLAVDCPIERR